MRRPPLPNNFIATMSNRITNLGFPTNIFDCQTYVLSGYLDKNFASLLRLLSPYTDDQKLEKVLLLGVKLNFFNSFANCQPNEFYKFMRHLRTPAGQGELKKIAIQEKLEKRAAARGFAVHEMAYVALAEIPVSDYLKPKHEIRRKLCEEIIAEYQKNQLKIAQLAQPALDCAKGDRSGTLAVEENVQGSGALNCAEDDQSGTLAVEENVEAPQEIIVEYQNQLKIAQPAALPALDCAEDGRSGRVAVEENVSGGGGPDNTSV